jgi:hypothetical protein
MIDLLTIFEGRYFQTETGTYYEEFPSEPSVSGVPFDYEHINPQERRYQMLFGNVSNNEGIITAIKTKDPLKWNIDTGYIALQDGTFYSIESVMKDYQSANKEAFRLLADVAGVEYVLRLVSQANPLKLG